MRSSIVILLALLVTSVSAEELCTYRQTTYLGSRPSGTSPGWHEAAQGITEDRENYWYITQNDLDAILSTPTGPNLHIIKKIKERGQ